MSVFLQYPALSGLLVLVAVPLLVHLLSRAKPPQYRFSNVEFLKKVMRLTSRFRKPKDWLLLALRSLALLALATAFLGPLLLSRNAPLPNEKRAIVLLIDRSASMSAKEGAASRFEAACAEAVRILDEAKPDVANIVWLDGSPDAVFPEPAPNRDFLREDLADASPRAETAALDAGVDLALRQLATASGRKELYLISDFQASAWKDFSPVVPDGVSLRPVQVAKSDVPNLAVNSLVPVPATPVAGQQMIVQCRVGNHSDEARRVSLTLDAGGSRQSQSLDLPARGEAEAAFSVRCSVAGLLPLTAEIDGDAFPGDNRRHAVVRVKESLRLGIAGAADAPGARTLERVADAVPWLDSLPVGTRGKIPPCEVLYVPEFTSDDVESLRELAGGGTAVLAIPSPRLDAGALAKVLGEAEPAPAGFGSSAGYEESTEGWEASPVAGHPAFHLFEGGEFGNPLGGKFMRRIRTSAPESAKVIGRFADGKPAMLEAKDRPLVVCNLPLDPAHGTWIAEPSFLPAVAELLLYMMPRHVVETFELPPGEALAWTAPEDDAAAAPVLRSPDGSSLPLAATGRVWRCPGPVSPGIHSWLVSGQPVHLSVVNFPESESLLKPLETLPGTDPVALAGGDAARRAALSGGLHLWPWLLAAALAFLLIEGLVAGLKPSSRTA